MRAGHIDIAYPFSAVVTPFVVRLSGGRERYACCATDALGMAPMVGEPVEIRSACHHSGAPLHFPATPHGVGPAAEGVMVWFGKRGDEECKAAESL
ncbi:MAG: organomercurial lyase [Candidatus Rokuibacteriota bacterium]